MLQVPDHPYRIIIFGASGSGKTNSLFNLKSHQTDIDKIYLYAKNPYETKYEFLIDNKESTALKYLNYSKAFTEYSNDMDIIYKNIEEYNSNKKHKILIVFDDMVADMLINKKLNPIVTEFPANICWSSRRLEDIFKTCFENVFNMSSA